MDADRCLSGCSLHLNHITLLLLWSDNWTTGEHLSQEKAIHRQIGSAFGVSFGDLTWDAQRVGAAGRRYKQKSKEEQRLGGYGLDLMLGLGAHVSGRASQ